MKTQYYKLRHLTCPGSNSDIRCYGHPPLNERQVIITFWAFPNPILSIRPEIHFLKSLSGRKSNYPNCLSIDMLRIEQ